MRIDVSIGELVDRASILSLKLERLEDPAKRTRVLADYERLKAAMAEIGIDENSEAFSALKAVNGRLWDAENAIRLKEKDKIFDDEFVQLSRNIYLLNDERSRIKLRINQQYESESVEEKEYTRYDS